MSFQCHVCAKVYNKQFNLNYHVAHHYEERPFSCPFPGCVNAYKTKSDLKQHQKSHEQQLGLKFNCNYKDCQEIFTCSKDLNIHRRHCLKSTKIMTWCKMCKRNFRDFGKHQKEVHEKKFKFICDFEGITFKKKNGLRRHIQSVHLKTKKCHCVPCNRSFSRFQALKRHNNSIFHKEILEKLEANKQSLCYRSADENEKQEKNDCKDLSLVQKQIVLSTLKEVPQVFSEEDDTTFNDNFAGVQDSSDSEVPRKNLDLLNVAPKMPTPESPAVIFKQEPVDSEENYQSEFACVIKQEPFEEKFEIEKDIPSNGNLPTNKKSSVVSLVVKRHKCKLCCQLFKSTEDFIKHFIMLHVKNLSDVLGSTSSLNKNKILCRQCDLCGEVFIYLQSLRAHMSKIHIHKAESNSLQKRKQTSLKKQKKCKECGDVVFGPGGIYSHMWRKHFNMKKIDYKFICLLCEQQMSSPSLAKRHHVQVHKSGKLLFRTCQECKIEFKLYKDFKQHCDENHSHLHICLLCGIRCQSMVELLKHGKYHRSVPENEKKFSCDLCHNFNAQQKKTIEAHMVKKHGAERRKYFATCDCCGAQFDSYHTFKGHMKMHELQKKGKQQCSYCDKGFFLTRDLLIHEDKHFVNSR